MLAFAATIIFTFLLYCASVQALFPSPQSCTSGNTTLALSPSFVINVHIASPPQDLLDAVVRTRARVLADRNKLLTPAFGADVLAAAPPWGELVELQLHLSNASVTARSVFEEATRPMEQRLECYHLRVPTDSSPAILSAPTTLGLLRGLTTFEQLWYSMPSDPTRRFAPNLPIEIDDFPWFPWRGFGLDTARNFFPLTDIKRTLDAMLMTKLNVFYWHIVDSQSFPLAFPDDPLLGPLAEKGSYSKEMSYSPEDVKEIVRYAGERGIDVVMEIDMPGHTDIIAEAYPNWVACHSGSPWASLANEPPAGQLRFVLPKVASLVSLLFNATAALIGTTYFSTGGDEINIPCYTSDKVTQDALYSSGITLEAALNTFINETHSTLAKLGKTPVVWQEMVLTRRVPLLNNTLVIVWVSSTDAALVAEQGFNIIHAPSDHFYLDCGQGGWLGNSQGASWCPFVTWQNMYAFDPYAGTPPGRHRLVKGGQTMPTGPESLDATAWPRAAAAAELWWKGGPAGSYPKETASVLPRLHDLRFRMVDRGIAARPLQPLWCALRPGACDLTA